MAERRGPTQIVNFPRITGGFREIPAADGDPDFDKVIFLAGFNGIDEATSFTEESSNAAVATFNGSAQLDTDQKQFGTTSARFDETTSDSITFPDLAAYDLGSGDFTIEMFLRFAILPFSNNKMDWIGQWDNSGPAEKSWSMQLLFNFGSPLFRWLHSTNGTTTLVYSVAWTPVIDTWYHVAFTRDGDSVRFFVDGVQQGSTGTLSSITLNASDETLLLGGLNNGGALINNLDGWLDEVRITKGLARYTSNFTAPTEEFPRA